MLWPDWEKFVHDVDVDQLRIDIEQQKQLIGGLDVQRQVAVEGGALPDSALIKLINDQLANATGLLETLQKQLPAAAEPQFCPTCNPNTECITCNKPIGPNGKATAEGGNYIDAIRGE